MVFNSLEPMTMWVDNEASMALAKNLKHYSRAKHIDVQYHYIREQVAAGIIRLERVESSDNVADILTKSLGKTKHGELARKLGIHERIYKDIHKISENMALREGVELTSPCAPTTTSGAGAAEASAARGRAARGRSCQGKRCQGQGLPRAGAARVSAARVSAA